LQASQLTGYYHIKPISTWLHTSLTGFDYNILRRRSMKPVKKFLFAVLLVSAIAINTPAGELDTPGAIPPPPRQMTTIYDGTTSGSDTEQPDSITVETADYLFLEALAALLSVY
jgi:hypothetical protein